MNNQELQTADQQSFDVSIVIVNWNARDYLRDCVKSIIAECKDYSYEVIVVDNASNDKSCEMLSDEFQSVQVIANSTNNGFAGAYTGFTTIRPRVRSGCRSTKRTAVPDPPETPPMRAFSMAR